jgi:hypothetical protein
MLQTMRRVEESDGTNFPGVHTLGKCDQNERHAEPYECRAPLQPKAESWA